jgi:hypothetical protein
VTERRAEEAPDRVTTQADRQEHKQQPTESLVRNRLDRPLLVRQLPRLADGDLEREEPDDAVDKATRHKPGPRKHLERRRLHETAADTASGLNRCRTDDARHDQRTSTHIRRQRLPRSRR